VLAIAVVLLLGADAPEQPAGEAPEAPAEARPTRVHLLPLPVPITGAVDTNVKRMIGQLTRQPTDEPGPRQIVILEFRPSKEDAGQGSEFERALSLARYLASEQLSGMRTVAFVPETVTGHAVLPVLACEEIVMAAEAELGDAGAGEEHVDDTMRSAYRDIAERRRTIPAPVAVSMLDGAATAYKVTTLEGVRYVTQEELGQLQQSGAVSSVETLMPAGEPTRLTGNELRLEHGFVSHLAADHHALLGALNLPPGALQQDPSLGGQWRPIRIDVNGPINAKAVNWLIRSTQQRLADAHPTNFICVAIDSPGGSLPDSLRLADFLASLDPASVRTVAFVESQARADASLVAWACDQLVVSEEALLGGPGDIIVDRDQVADLQRALQALAKEKVRDWSLALALVDPELPVHYYSDGADERLFCEAELAEQADPGRWVRGESVDTSKGLSGGSALDLRVAQHQASSLAELRQLYQIEEDLERVEPNWAHLAIERLAAPRVAGTLLFIAWFTLVIEMSHPGIGVAGFASALCFLLFFWSQFLHGTAAWLEVLLFVAGLASLAIELLVLPGFGVFGFGGAGLVIVSLLLASQTFVIPRNSYQFDQFANSLMMVSVGLAGAFASMFIVRKYLPDAPLFKRMMLTTDDDEWEERQERELLADYRHLLGKRGRTTTQLTPSGKARFGDDIVDVICHGEAVSRDTEVVVHEVRGNRVLVRPVQEEKA